MHHDRPAGRTGIAGLPQWPTAIARLGALYEAHGAEAEARAHRYADRYRGRRAAMVFDVVASRQRRYETRVLPMVDRFAQTEAARSLEALVRLGVGAEFRLRQGEVETMRGVAEGLLRFGRDHGLEDDETIARRWAEGCGEFEHASSLEPYVGSVRGVGPALLAYLRMRSGADAIKPDLRVRDGLNRLGFTVPNDVHAILAVATAAARELGISRLVLDQLLWWQTA